MTTKDFIKKRKSLQKDLKGFQKKINVLYTKISKQYINENSPVKVLKVYELIENGIKRRGYNRFVVYTLDISVFSDSPSIRAGGWWLNKKNIPEKWDTMSVTGVGNPAVFILSKNQKNEKHPDNK